MWKKYRAGGVVIYANDTITSDPFFFFLFPSLSYFLNNNNASDFKLGV